ncbi:MAG TPA: hypothetical protein VGF49_03205 [Candidatus Solibacter sp.]|jgi:hypothetical protein
MPTPATSNASSITSSTCLEVEEFNIELAGARLLGRDVNSERLIADLITQLSQVCDPFEERPDRAETPIDHFHRGITDHRT